MKIMFKRVLALMAVGAAGVLLLTGCGSAEEKFIGDWHSVGGKTEDGESISLDIDSDGAGIQLEIKENGTYKQIIIGEETSVHDGNWEIDENDDTVLNIMVKGKVWETVNYIDDNNLKMEAKAITVDFVKNE